GYSKTEIVGKPCFDFIASGYKKTALDGFKEMKEKGMGPIIEIQLIKKNGVTFFGVCHGAKIGGELQESDLYLITIQDVSLIHEALEKAKRAEEEVEKKYDELKKTYDILLATEEKYKHLYDNSPDLLRTIDLNGMIVDCNKAYEKNLGYTRDEIIGSSIVKHTAERSYDDLEK
ncbi:MAG: PAS domain S-box protein, partial [Thaumarchaeota archaeon]|nr:PAS domain S-box protein [Nitrososphaerota archaeon]